LADYRRSPMERKLDTDPNLVRNTSHLPDEIRLVDFDETYVCSRATAITRMRDTELDLYLVNAQAKPPVYKLLDYGRYRFEDQKKKREQQRKMREQNRPVKEFKFKPAIDDHDIGVKLHHIRENLTDHDVKVCLDLKRNAFVLTNRGRRSLHEVIADPAFVLNRILDELKGQVQPVRLTTTDNQVYAILKNNVQEQEVPA
jgi:translation initiation factor IF-3